MIDVMFTMFINKVSRNFMLCPSINSTLPFHSSDGSHSVTDTRNVIIFENI